MTNKKVKISSSGFNLWYEDYHALHDIDLDIYEKSVTALIGASGCGKTSFLRAINRMNDHIPGCKMKGEIYIDAQNIYDKSVDLVKLRTKVGMVFQKPNPFPKSIYDNVAYGPRLHGLAESKEHLDYIVERSLIRAGLFEEVKGKLGESAFNLSGGQSQRLCIARTIAINPEIILMDEPCSALDPIATAKIESLIDELKLRYTIVIVTHSMQQAARVSDRTSFFSGGKIIESNYTGELFTNPRSRETQFYITARDE